VDSSQKKPKSRSKCVDNISTETDTVILQSDIEFMKRKLQEKNEFITKLEHSNQIFEDEILFLQTKIQNLEEAYGKF